MFGKQFLRPDRPPVFNTPEITHDDELIETTDLLVRGVDLLNDLRWSADEGETSVEDLFIRQRAKLLDDSTGVEAEAFGTPFGLLFLTYHCVHGRSIEVEVVTEESFQLLPDVLLVVAKVHRANKRDMRRMAMGGTGFLVGFDTERRDRPGDRSASGHTEAPLSSHTKTVVAGAYHVEWRMGLLHGLGHDCHLLHRVELTVEGEPFLAPGAPQDLNGLVKAWLALFHCHTRGLIEPRMSAPDPAFQSTVCENIRLRNLSCQEQRIVQRECMTERPEANPVGTLGCRCEQRQWVRRDAKLLEKVMLDHRIGIESDGIRMLDLAHNLPGQLRMGLVQGRLHFRIDSETHQWSPPILP